MEKGFTYIILLLLTVLAAAVGLTTIKQHSPAKNQENSIINPSPAITTSQTTTPAPVTLPPQPSPSSQVPTTISSVLTVAQVMSSPENYLDKKASVQGNIFIRTYFGTDSAQPCPANQPDCADTPSKSPTLHLVNPDNPWGETGNIDLYRKNSSGSYQQITCQNASNCGSYKLNTVTTLQGLFTKEQVPYQIVGNSSGYSEVIKTKNHYFLVVE